MARGFWHLTIWLVLVVICSSTVESKRRSFLAAVFDVPYDNPMHDDSTFFQKAKTSRESGVMLDLLNSWDDYQYVVPLLFMKRRQNVYPNVEVGPGAYKSEKVQYPSDALKKQLSNLLQLKKKLEERRQT